MNAKCMKGSEFNIKAGQEDFRQCLPTLRYHGLKFLDQLSPSGGSFGGLFNTELSQQDEDIIGASGFQPFKAPPSGYSLPSFRSKQTWLLEQRLSTPF